MPRVLVPLAEGFEEMEGIIILDVLRRAGIEAVSAGLQSGPIKAARGTNHLADMTIEGAADQDWDMIVLPGGLPGATNLEKHSVVQAILKKMDAANKPIGAICAAPNVLRNLGILRADEEFTVFPGSEGRARGGIHNPARVVRSGNITTSIGPGSAFEFALDLVEQLLGAAARAKVTGPLQLPPAMVSA